MKRLLVFTVCLFTFSVAAAAQTPTTWGYSTGYGNVYGSFGLAQTMQSMSNVARAQALKRNTGAAARPASSGQVTARSNAKPVVEPRVVRNYGKFVPDPNVETGRSFADALGETPEERQLITNIYTATKTAFDKEAFARGWQNNIAGGLTFFTVTALTIYHASEEPSDAGLQSYYEILNTTFDEMPEFRSVSNRDKQNFNNMTVGFAGLLLAGYLEGKQTGNAETIASYRKLAGVMINMVLKTDPENIKVENGQIVMK